jgi:site-specific DNA-methyltransferase (adenine-specific)
VNLQNGDCIEVMRSMPDNSVDAVVTDPPYGLSFMGKKWDYDVPSEEVWRECLRVLKPGGHLLAFAGTRTQHRMACRIEDAGFEIRDMIAWVYGSGFPKSLDVSKAIDKSNGDPNRLHKFTAWMRSTGLTARQLDELTGTNMGGHYLTKASQPAIPTPELWEVIRPQCRDVPSWVDELVERIQAERKVVGHAEMRDTSEVRIAVCASADDYNATARRKVSITAPATAAARQWQGWGTALKPALEPITMARKPFTSSVAANVVEHGTGAINVDGCRVGDAPAGRWPANLIHDDGHDVQQVLGDASRFFYCPKASSSDRGEKNIHPTVKPTDLMRYLCRLVTQPAGVVLDPFMGSGSTGKAAVLEGFSFVGIERDPQYFEIAKRRVQPQKESSSVGQSQLW